MCSNMYVGELEGNHFLLKKFMGMLNEGSFEGKEEVKCCRTKTFLMCQMYVFDQKLQINIICEGKSYFYQTNDAFLLKSYT